MTILRRRGAGVVVAAVASLALAGSALAATQAGPPKNPPRYGMQQGAGLGVMAGGLTIDAAADYIGVSESDLIAARHAGKSLGQIATEHGKTVAGLEQALVKAFEANLDKAVAAHREAAKLFPNNSQVRAQLAWTLHVAGDAKAADEAAQALRLDEQNKHKERELAKLKVYDPGPAPSLPRSAMPPGPADRNAGDLMKMLRR